MGPGARTLPYMMTLAWFRGKDGMAVVSQDCLLLFRNSLCTRLWDAWWKTWTWIWMARPEQHIQKPGVLLSELQETELFSAEEWPGWGSHFPSPGLFPSPSDISPSWLLQDLLQEPMLGLELPHYRRARGQMHPHPQPSVILAWQWATSWKRVSPSLHPPTLSAGSLFWQTHWVMEMKTSGRRAGGC